MTVEIYKISIDFQWDSRNYPGSPSQSPVAQITNMVLTLIPAWISNYIHRKAWDEITYSFLNFNGCTVEV